MASGKNELLRSDKTDCIAFNSYVLGQNKLIKLEDLWSRTNNRLGSRRNEIVQTMDGSFSTTKTFMCGRQDFTMIRTTKRDRLKLALDAEILNAAGEFVRVRNLVVGSELFAGDNYSPENKHSKQNVELTSFQQLKAFLKGHGIPYSVEGNIIKTKEVEWYCKPFDSDVVITESNQIHVGNNNVIKAAMDHFGVPRYSTDRVTHIEYVRSVYGIALQFESQHGIIVHNGTVIRSTGE